MTGRAASQVTYLAGLASRVASAQPPLRLQPAQAPGSLQPPRPLFAGPAYCLDGPQDPALDQSLDRALGLGLDPAPGPGDNFRHQDGLAGTSGSETAETAPTRWAGFPLAEAATQGPPARPGTRAHGSTPAAEAPGPSGAHPSGLHPSGTGPSTSRPSGVAPGTAPSWPAPMAPGPSWPGSPQAATPRTSASRDRAPRAGVAGSTSGRGAESSQVMTVEDTDGPDADAGAPAAASLLATGRPLAAPGSGPGRAEATGPGPAARLLARDWPWGAPVELPAAHRKHGSTVQGPAGTAGTVRDLLPPAGTEHAGPSRSRREPPGRVTIGTIEVTVIPSARPAHGAGTPPQITPPPTEPLPAAYPAAPRFAEAGTARLRDGLRRWYGIAQS